VQLTFEKGQFVLKNRFKESREVLDLKKAKKYSPVADRLAHKILYQTRNWKREMYQLPPLIFLDAHQREGIEWILSRQRSYLAHAPGAGKTYQAICSACMLPEPGPTLIIVPPTLTLNWQREIKKLTQMISYYPTTSIVPLSSEQDEMDWSSDFIICPDSMLTKRWVYTKLLKLNPKFIAVDEASRFKEPFSQRSKAFYGGKHDNVSYPGLFQKAHHVVLLDGSPMPNRPLELWTPTYALSPESIDCMNYFDFGFRYGGAKKNRYTGDWEFKGSTNEAELNEKLTKDFMHVVTEDKLDHPERLRSILLMTEDPRSPQLKKWEQKDLKNLSFLNLKENQNEGLLSEYRREVGLSKIKWTAEYVKQRLEDKNESILLFAWHREVCEGLSKALEKYKPTIIYGGVKSEQREDAFKNFNNGRRKLLIGNIQACGRGHNLQKADRVIFAEYSWTDELNKQCEKRASRRGNNKASIRCEYIVIPDSIDEIILQSVFTKAKRVKKVIG
jgi:SWI/SNF-related matrix-associated actin-dependent regulator of chromatin subfamily A-like protein 1